MCDPIVQRCPSTTGNGKRASGRGLTPHTRGLPSAVRRTCKARSEAALRETVQILGGGAALAALAPNAVGGDALLGCEKMKETGALALTAAPGPRPSAQRL